MIRRILTSGLLAAGALALSACGESGPGETADENTAPANHAAPTAPNANASPIQANTSEEMVSQLFGSFDRDGDGAITRPEALSYIVLVLLSKDSDHDGRVSEREFQDWDIGFDSIATSNGRQAQYTAAKDAMFKGWDSNGDGFLDVQEFTSGSARDFRAIAPADGGIGRAEFAELAYVKRLAEAASL